MNTKQYWADALTINCIWLVQRRIVKVADSGEKTTYWSTEAVFADKQEADTYGERNKHHYGLTDDSWRRFGVPCYGVMAELLAEHKEEFLHDSPESGSDE